MENFLDSALSTDEKDLIHTISKINNLETDDLLSWIDSIIPNWLITHTKDYAKEYYNLERNWYQLCQQWNVKPKHIIIVRFIPQNHELSNYSILWTLCNRLTKDGNIIRTPLDLSLCERCTKAILSKNVIERIQKVRKSIPNPSPTDIPSIWSPLCKECEYSA